MIDTILYLYCKRHQVLLQQYQRWQEMIQLQVVKVEEYLCNWFTSFLHYWCPLDSPMLSFREKSSDKDPVIAYQLLYPSKNYSYLSFLLVHYHCQRHSTTTENIKVKTNSNNSINWIWTTTIFLIIILYVKM